MLSLPSGFASVILAFAPLFRHSVWSAARLLLVGAVLAPGRRTVASVLRIVGLGSEPHFQNYHRVLNRVRWSSRAAKSFHIEGRTLRQRASPASIFSGPS